VLSIELLLLPGVGSVVPAGAATVAVFDTPMVPGGKVAVIVIVTLPLFGSVVTVPDTSVPLTVGGDITHRTAGRATATGEYAGGARWQHIVVGCAVGWVRAGIADQQGIRDRASAFIDNRGSLDDGKVGGIHHRDVGEAGN
jgi:hypothetical protein